MTQSNPERLLIFDTTLRDGEQSPGCSMTPQEKLRVARALAELGVDVLEAGFPAASPGDFESVRTIASTVEGPTICALARCNPQDIERAWEAIKEAPRRRLHVFVATSAIHRKYKLRMARREVLRRAVDSVRRAREHLDDVEFSPEDAARTEPAFLAKVVEAAIAAGATTVNIPDTVGYTVPDEFARLFEYLKTHVGNIDQATLSVHCHDDLGLAVANSLAAVHAGARQVECTINGIGERAGNCSLEEVVMAVRTRKDFFALDTGIDTTRLYAASRLVADITGMHVPANKAVVGENAFAHEAGIHQHGMLQHHSTYEIMRPQEVGFKRTSLVLGKHSGRHAFRERIVELGFELEETEFERAFGDFKALADEKKHICDADIEALVLHAEPHDAGPWQIQELRITAGTGALATATIQLAHLSGEVREEAAVGDGPIEAAFTAIERAAGIEIELHKFVVRNATPGEEALGEATVTIGYSGESYEGTAFDRDIVVAGAQAFVRALNRAASRSDSVRSRARQEQLKLATS